MTRSSVFWPNHKKKIGILWRCYIILMSSCAAATICTDIKRKLGGLYLIGWSICIFMTTDISHAVNVYCFGGAGFCIFLWFEVMIPCGTQCWSINLTWRPSPASIKRVTDERCHRGLQQQTQSCLFTSSICPAACTAAKSRQDERANASGSPPLWYLQQRPYAD